MARNSNAEVTDPAARSSATAELWEEFGSRLRAFVANRVAEPEDVDDIVQDVFLRAHQHLSSVRSQDKVTSWLYQIARNVITDHYRAAPRRREQPVAQVDDYVRGLSCEMRTDDQDALRREMLGCVQPLLAQLPPRLREALELTDLSGKSQAAAAAQLGLSVSGMKSRVQRARTQLNQLIHQACELEIDARGGPVTCEPTNRPR